MKPVPSALSRTIQQRLHMYSLAAGAAGVSAFALAPAAGAEVVYTPAHVAILGPHGSYSLDLNHDGVVDFKITNTTRSNTDQAFWAVFANAQAGNAVIGTFVYRGFPADARALDQGSQIGPSQRFFPRDVKMASFYVGGGGYSAHGNWPHAVNRYLGVQFQVDGQTHYGWARFTVQTLGHPVRILAELTGYAYETTANAPIAAGQTSGGPNQVNPDETTAGIKPESRQAPGDQPATLGLLAMGSPAFTVWRRKN
jgi:hypothetical protein